MKVLPDILAPKLAVVFCGTAVGECQAARGHYYAGPGNSFWQLLCESGLTPHRLRPVDDVTMPSYGYGLTDLVKVISESEDRRLRFDVATLVANLETYSPRWVAFTNKAAGQAAARSLGFEAPGLGLADWRLAQARVFVLPSASGANRRREYDGRPTRVAWWRELAYLQCGTRSR